MKLSRKQLRKLITESAEEVEASASTLKDKVDYTAKLKNMISSDPSMENIKQTFELASSVIKDENVTVDMKQFHLSAFESVYKMVKNANVLEHRRVDNVIYEIDEILYQVRDIGLKAMNMGIESVDRLEDMGQLSEDQVYETGMELVSSVRTGAMDAIERSMAQVILATLK